MSYIIELRENDTLPVDADAVTQAVKDGIDNNTFPFTIDKATVVHQGG